MDTGTENFVYYWSTETLLNDVHNADLRPAQISSIEVDDDRNGLMDRWLILLDIDFISLFLFLLW